MAGDWIKMRGNLWDDPRVTALCDACNCGEAQVIGALYWLWATADQHTEDGLMPGLTLRQIDRKTGVKGFGAALAVVGWVAESADGVTLARFDEHNGASAKRRCTEAQRKANGRSVSASNADKKQTGAGQKSPSCGAREEEEEEKRDSDPDGSGGKPPAPPSPPAPKTAADEADAKLWRDLKALFVETSAAKDIKAAGVLLGGLSAKYGADLFKAAGRALLDVRPVPGEPHTYLVSLCETGAGKRPALNKQAALEDSNLAAAAAFAGA